MLSTWRRQLVGTAVCGVLVLTGCTADPVPTPASPAPQTPVFASDEEARAAATEVYTAYQFAMNLILSEGGANPDRIRAVASGPLAATDIASFEQAHRQGLRSLGEMTFGAVALHSRDDSAADGVGIVTLTLCSDVSHVDLQDATGESVIVAGRPDRTAFEVSFDLRTAGSNDLLVGERVVSPGGGVC